MRIPLPSNKRSFLVKVGIRAQEPMQLGIRCSDPRHRNTDFIRRRVPFTENLFVSGKSAYREFTLPFPVSPDALYIDLFDKYNGGDGNFKLEAFKVEPMKPAQVWAEPEIHRFIDFAQDFALKAGYVPAGSYDSADGDFLIQYVPAIEDAYGNKLITPARTNRVTGRIQVSQEDFTSYTIPVRLVVLFHERYHYQIPTRLEKPADLHALRLYLDLGYPRTEAVYATTKIFLNHPDTIGETHRNRVRDVVQFIDDYSAKHELKNYA